ncbi:hypothetical protein G9U51_13790 [Calidifontibacter sp. DB0510]|uniref:Uncharacterized protein n=1 Tax=Metallococcus carri TaxID=1656884 RepID=A0A967B3Z2_9MICO|nr:hypothetical protein [Metallococcus carri]NHN56845.1 hypothetical protein [Metallococcus carri]NOP37778.1 hypothetical protein [Calidifontibacter sp. DB2511S]
MTDPILFVVGAAEAALVTAAVVGRAAARGDAVVAVDLAAWQGPLDVWLGLEHLPGVRWDAFVGAEGALDGDALVSRLPAAGGVAVLSHPRGLPAPIEPPLAGEVLAAVRGRPAVVVVRAGDPSWLTPLRAPDDPVAIVTSDRVPELTAAYAAGAAAPGAVLLTVPTAGDADPEWEEELAVFEEVVVRRADWRSVQRGRIPGDGRRSRLGRAADGLLDLLDGAGRQAA